MEPKLIFDPSKKRPMRIACFMSGSGTNVRKIIEHQNKLERESGRTPYEVALIFTDNPDIKPNAELIPIITIKNINKIESYLRSSSGIDVTGGMLHKVKMMLELTKFGIESEVINAKKPGILKNALLGDKDLGTIIRKD